MRACGRGRTPKAGPVFLELDSTRGGGSRPRWLPLLGVGRSRRARGGARKGERRAAEKKTYIKKYMRNTKPKTENPHCPAKPLLCLPANNAVAGRHNIARQRRWGGGRRAGCGRCRGGRHRKQGEEVLAHVLQDVLRHVLQASRPVSGDSSGGGGDFHEKVGWLCERAAREK